MTSYTKELTPQQAEKLKQILSERSFEWLKKEYCLYAAKGQAVNVAVYEKGPKVLVQGKGTQDFIIFILEPEVLGAVETQYDEVLHPEWFTPHFGIDESGKGDFFGPLVIAGAYVDATVVKHLLDLGVVDSKKISSDAKMRQLAQAMRKIPGFKYEIIAIGPEKYNALYEKFQNLNRLLAWGHAKVIENLLLKVPNCPRALSDQFANPAVLQNALQKKGKDILLEQRTKAESDPAVAAASILARECFINWLEDKGKILGLSLLKGVSQKVKDLASELYQQHGDDFLDQISKSHFKTSAEVKSQIK